jgi:D-3-phosphoglycerate dehydrogenase / 2-oxoglutarate reductase
MADRFALWRQPVARIAAAGGPEWQLAPSVARALRESGVDLVETLLTDGSGAVPAVVSQADILVSGVATIDDAICSQLSNVRFVVRPYVGFDDIDVDAVTRHGLLFANVPDAFIEEVANHTLALILAVNRKLIQADAFVKSGRWSAGEPNRADVIPVRRASALTLGLVGFGNIARLVLERARPFGFNVIAADPYVQPEAAEAMGVRLIPLDELLAVSDIVSVHVLLNAETRGLLDARRIGLMKRDAYLVNTSRGPVVDEAALSTALASGHLAGAGLDVFEVEPIAPDSPLLQLPNLVLTPHIASYSEEGDVAHDERTVDIIRRVVDGGLPERKVVINKALYDEYAERLLLAPTGRGSG